MNARVKDVIAEGDLVILYGGMDSISPVYVKSGEVYNSRFGSFHHDDLRGLG